MSDENAVTKVDKKAARAEKRSQKQRINASRSLRRKMIKFAQDERFAPALAKALPIYWNGFYSLETADEMDFTESLRFFDWFFFDFDDGEVGRPYQAFVAEMGDALDEKEQEVLAGWGDVFPPSAYEYLDYDGYSNRFKLRDYFTKEEFTAVSTAGPGASKKSDLILTRLVPVGSDVVFSVVAAYIPEDEIEGLTERFEEAREKDQAENPEASYADFFRRHSHLVVYHALAKSVELGRFAVSRLDPTRVDKAVKRTAKKVAKKFKRKKK